MRLAKQVHENWWEPMNSMPMWSHYHHTWSLAVSWHIQAPSPVLRCAPCPPLAAPGGYVFRTISASIGGELLRPAILHRVPHLLLCHQCYMTLAKSGSGTKENDFRELSTLRWVQTYYDKWLSNRMECSSMLCFNRCWDGGFAFTQS